MGNCVQQSQHQPSVNSSLSSVDNLSNTFHRNIFANRFSNLRAIPTYNLTTLIDETLLVIRTVVNNDQDPPHAMLVLSRIANREDRWLEVIVALVERVPISDPLGATVIALLLDECLLPSKELLQQLIKRLCSNNQTKIKSLQRIVDEHIEQVSEQQNNNRTISSTIGKHVGHVTTIDNDSNESTPVLHSTSREFINEQQSSEKLVLVFILNANYRYLFLEDLNYH